MRRALGASLARTGEEKPGLAPPPAAERRIIRERNFGSGVAEVSAWLRVSLTAKAALDHQGRFLHEQRARGFPSKFACSIFCGLSFGGGLLQSKEEG